VCVVVLSGLGLGFELQGLELGLSVRESEMETGRYIWHEVPWQARMGLSSVRAMNRLEPGHLAIVFLAGLFVLSQVAMWHCDSKIGSLTSFLNVSIPTTSTPSLQFFKSESII
jgi:hypothetical protein